MVVCFGIHTNIGIPTYVAAYINTTGVPETPNHGPERSNQIYGSYYHKISSYPDGEEMEFKELMRKCYDTADETGWHDNPFNFVARIGNMHSELSEAFDAYRKGGQDARKMWYTRTTRQTSRIEDMDGIIETKHIYTAENEKAEYFIRIPGQKPPKPEGVPAEFADVLIWMMDACQILDIDLEAAILEKLEYNRHRDYRHGNLPF